MFRQHQTVGAGDRDAFVFQRANDRFEQFAALPHQNQNVAVTHGAALDAYRLAPFDQLPNCARDAPGQLDPRARLADLIEWRIPAFDFATLVRFRRFPDFDLAGRRIGQGDVRAESRRYPM